MFHPIPQQQEEEEAQRIANEKEFLDKRAADADEDDWINPINEDVTLMPADQILMMDEDQEEDHAQHHDNEDELAKSAKPARGWGTAAAPVAKQVDTSMTSDGDAKENAAPEPAASETPLATASEPAAKTKSAYVPPSQRGMADGMSGDWESKGSRRGPGNAPLALDDVMAFPTLDAADELAELKKAKEKEESELR